MQDPSKPCEELDELDTIAATFVLYARADIAERFENFETSRMNLESLIDNCSDHNQLMLDAMHDIKPEWFHMFEDVLTRGSDEDVAGWFAVVNELFDRARELLKTLED